jgi:hypothetical protein
MLAEATLIGDFSVNEQERWQGELSKLVEGSARGVVKGWQHLVLS